MSALAKLTLAIAFAASSATLTMVNAAEGVAETTHATDTADSSGTSGQQATAVGKTSESAATMSEGEIKKIDKESGKLTIKHGPLTNLDMPGMTMVFRVKDPAMIEQVNVGDKISFVADKVGGQFTVIQLEVVK